MFRVFSIDEILRYRGTRFPGSRTLCHPASITNNILLHQNRKIGCSTNNFGGDRQEACLVLISEFFTKSLLSSTFYPDTCKMKRATENKSTDSLPEQTTLSDSRTFSTSEGETGADYQTWGRGRKNSSLTSYPHIHPTASQIPRQWSINWIHTLKQTLFSWILPL